MEHEHNHEHSSGIEGCAHCHEEENEITLKQIIAAAVLFVVAVIVEHLPIFQEESALLSSTQSLRQTVFIGNLVLLCAA